MKLYVYEVYIYKNNTFKYEMIPCGHTDVTGIAMSGFYILIIRERFVPCMSLHYIMSLKSLMKGSLLYVPDPS